MNATRSLEDDVLINEVQTGLSTILFNVSFTTSDNASANQQQTLSALYW